MRYQSIWSISLGKWIGIHIRVHMFFLLFAAFTLYLCSQDRTGDESDWDGAALLVVLFVSVLIHEIGHAMMAARLGGNTDEIVIGPFGGLGRFPNLMEAPSELLAAIAGPLVNAAICILAALVLFSFGEFRSGLMNPLAADVLADGFPLIAILKMVFWVNWILFIANLIPAFPFDGGRIVRSLIVTSWPQMEPRLAAEFTSRLAKVIAVGLLVAAALFSTDGDSLIPIWLPLVLLSIFVYFSAKSEEASPSMNPNGDSFMGYDFSEGFTSLERSAQPCSIQAEAASSPLTSWLQNRRDQRDRRRKEREADEDSRVDEILSRVHEAGFDSLSIDDQELLKRVSLRYQNRKSE